MAMTGVPPWGCPWHGLVRGGVLQLPNGQQIDYPQPATGGTIAVRHPAAPPLPEEDTSSVDGRQWWRAAILAGVGHASVGCALHGTRLIGGEPNRNWLYIDGEGGVWLVRPGFVLSSTAAFDVELIRFGVLGGIPEQYTYSVTNNIEPGALGRSATLADARPTGDRALFRIHDSAGLPIGWFELSLSGPGRNCEISVQMLATRAQTVGTPTHVDVIDYRVLRINYTTEETDTRVAEPPCGGELRRTTSCGLVPGAEIGAISFSESVPTQEESVSGLIIAMWYDETGAVVPVTVDYGYRCESVREESRIDTIAQAVSRLRSLLSGDGDSCFNSAFRDAWGEFELVQAGTSTCRVWITVTAGGVVMELEHHTRRAWMRVDRITENRTYPGNFNWVSGTLSTTSTEYDGTVTEVTQAVASAPLLTFSEDKPFPPVPLVASGDRGVGWTIRLLGQSSDQYRDVTTTVRRMTNNVMAVVTSSSSTIPGTPSIQHVGPCITPVGIYEPTYDLSVADWPYASYCPITHQLAVDNAPICWT